MMVPYNYEINVSKNGIHYCHIELRGVNLERQAVEKLKELRTFFPEDFELTLTHVICYGERVEV